MKPDTRLSSGEVADPKLHRRYTAIVGAIGWLNSGTTPDLSYCYAELSKFAARPGKVHMNAAEYCLAYISGTFEKGIVYRAGRPGEGDILSGSVDADFAADLDTHAASEAGKEIIHLRRILDDFGFEQKNPTTLHEDSRAVICMAENPVNRKSSRHIDTLRHCIGELVAAGEEAKQVTVYQILMQVGQRVYVKAPYRSREGNSRFGKDAQGHFARFRNSERPLGHSHSALRVD